MEANGLLAIIGGTGVDLRGADSPLTNARDEVVETRWGRTQITHALLDGREIVFLQRHAASSLDANKAVGQAIPPHRVNYRANIAALKKIGATAIFASTAVGALRPEYAPGSLVLLDQFIDMTTQRDKTFFDDRAVHIDMTEPYCARLRSLLLLTAEDLNIALHAAATYVCTDGPRFETGAEVRAYASWGGDVVGMTGAPECALAREADISYAGVSIVTNLGAGLSAQPLTQAEVLDTMRTTLPQIMQLFLSAARDYLDDSSTRSRRAAEEFGSPPVF
jgi:5'-methylthioadenosine phosphorylase